MRPTGPPCGFNADNAVAKEGNAKRPHCEYALSRCASWRTHVILKKSRVRIFDQETCCTIYVQGKLQGLKERCEVASCWGSSTRIVCVLELAQGFTKSLRTRSIGCTKVHITISFFIQTLEILISAASPRARFQRSPHKVCIRLSTLTISLYPKTHRGDS